MKKLILLAMASDSDLLVYLIGLFFIIVISVLFIRYVFKISLLTKHMRTQTLLLHAIAKKIGVDSADQITNASEYELDEMYGDIDQRSTMK